MEAMGELDPYELDDKSLKEKLTCILTISFYEMYKEEYDLFNMNVDEVTIVSKLAFYIQTYLDQCETFKGYKVDIEYNRYGQKRENIKRINKTRNIRPDLIIHKRGFKDKNNILVAEFKKQYNNCNKYKDKCKIKKVIEEFKYRFGFCTELIRKEKHTNHGIPLKEIKKFINDGFKLDVDEKKSTDQYAN